MWKVTYGKFSESIYCGVCFLSGEFFPYLSKRLTGIDIASVRVQKPDGTYGEPDPSTQTDVFYPPPVTAVEYVAKPVGVNVTLLWKSEVSLAPYSCVISANGIEHRNSSGGAIVPIHAEHWVGDEEPIDGGIYIKRGQGMNTYRMHKLPANVNETVIKLWEKLKEPFIVKIPHAWFNEFEKAGMYAVASFGGEVLMKLNIVPSKRFVEHIRNTGYAFDVWETLYMSENRMFAVVTECDGGVLMSGFSMRYFSSDRYDHIPGELHSLAKMFTQQLIIIKAPLSLVIGNSKQLDRTDMVQWVEYVAQAGSDTKWVKAPDELILYFSDLFVHGSENYDFYAKTRQNWTKRAVPHKKTFFGYEEIADGINKVKKLWEADKKVLVQLGISSRPAIVPKKTPYSSKLVDVLKYWLPKVNIGERLRFVQMESWNDFFWIDEKQSVSYTFSPQVDIDGAFSQRVKNLVVDTKYIAILTTEATAEKEKLNGYSVFQIDTRYSWAVKQMQERIDSPTMMSYEDYLQKHAAPNEILAIQVTRSTIQRLLTPNDLAGVSLLIEQLTWEWVPRLVTCTTEIADPLKAMDKFYPAFTVNGKPANQILRFRVLSFWEDDIRTKYIVVYSINKNDRVNISFPELKTPYQHTASNQMDIPRRIETALAIIENTRIIETISVPIQYSCVMNARGYTVEDRNIPAIEKCIRGETVIWDDRYSRLIVWKPSRGLKRSRDDAESSNALKRLTSAQDRQPVIPERKEKQTQTTPDSIPPTIKNPEEPPAAAPMDASDTANVEEPETGSPVAAKRSIEPESLEDDGQQAKKPRDDRSSPVEESNPVVEPKSEIIPSNTGVIEWNGTDLLEKSKSYQSPVFPGNYILLQNRGFSYRNFEWYDEFDGYEPYIASTIKEQYDPKDGAIFTPKVFGALYVFLNFEPKPGTPIDNDAEKAPVASQKYPVFKSWTDPNRLVLYNQRGYTFVDENYSRVEVSQNVHLVSDGHTNEDNIAERIKWFKTA